MSPWPHRIACLTVVLALPLLFLGAEVTTKGVGMADQRALVNPVQAVVEMATTEQSAGWKIEHIHRLAGWLVGMCGIALAVSLWLTEPRRWICWAGTFALLLIIVQGLLGIFRVRLNALWGSELAWVHGCFAQVVFAGLVSVALITGREWRDQPEAPAPLAEPKLRRWSVLGVALVYVQLILGGMVRHQGSSTVARLHLLTAFLVLGALVWLIKLARESDVRARLFGATSILLHLLVVQVFLGVEAWFSWMTRFFVPHAALEESTAMHWLRSAHYLTGALILATTVALAWKVLRRPSQVPSSSRPLQEASA